MIKLLIISDDFTGALDTGVQFASSGASTYVMVDSEIDYTNIASNVEVVVIDAETRHLNKEEAFKIVFSIVSEACKIGIPYIYKKTDSVLRGNIGAELTALLQASQSKHIHFIPAFPKMGRTTEGGIQFVNGVPLSQSVFGQDPFAPVNDSEIKKIIASQCETEVHIMGTEINESFLSADGIQVYDSVCNEDIEIIASGLMEKDEMHIIAGCAGFASILPKILKIGGEPPLVPEIKPNMLVACGSVNPISVAQCDYTESKGAPRFRLSAEQKLSSDWVESCDADAFIDKLNTSCEKNSIVILDTNDMKDGENTRVSAQKRGITSAEMRTKITSVMGRLLEKLIDKGFDGTILIMGGDSFIGFIHQAGIKLVSPVCEIDCGVVLSQVKYKEKTLNVISKSGGFGKEMLFSDLSEMLSKLNEG